MASQLAYVFCLVTLDCQHLMATLRDPLLLLILYSMHLRLAAF